MRILCVSTSGPDLDYLIRSLNEAGHSTDLTKSVSDGAYMATVERYAAVVLLMAQNASMEIQKFSGRPNRTALVVISRAMGKDHRVEVLKAGADAYLQIPYAFLELQARLDALTRWQYQQTNLGPNIPGRSVQLDPTARSVRWSSSKLVFPRKEYQLIECLVRFSDEIVSRADLLRYVWGEDGDVDPKSVDVMVSRIRKRLRAIEDVFQILTVAGKGYRLIAAPASTPHSLPKERLDSKSEQ